MTEIVTLDVLLGSYLTTWCPIAPTSSVADLHIYDVLRRTGFGGGAEEILVEAIGDAPPRLLLRRGHRATKVEVHPLGSVWEVIESNHPPAGASSAEPEKALPTAEQEKTPVGVAFPEV